MATYLVFDRITGKDCYGYEASTISNTEAYPLDAYSHELQIDGLPSLPPGEVEKRTTWLIDPGSFFDRFGQHKLAIRMSDNPYVRAVVEDAKGRDWIDLKHPEVAVGIDIIIAAGLFPAEMKGDVLDRPVNHMEQLVLLTLYGEALNNGN